MRKFPRRKLQRLRVLSRHYRKCLKQRSLLVCCAKDAHLEISANSLDSIESQGNIERVVRGRGASFEGLRAWQNDGEAGCPRTVSDDLRLVGITNEELKDASASSQKPLEECITREPVLQVTEATKLVPPITKAQARLIQARQQFVPPITKAKARLIQAQQQKVSSQQAGVVGKVIGTQDRAEVWACPKCEEVNNIVCDSCSKCKRERTRVFASATCEAPPGIFNVESKRPPGVFHLPASVQHESHGDPLGARSCESQAVLSGHFQAARTATTSMPTIKLPANAKSCIVGRPAHVPHGKAPASATVVPPRVPMPSPKPLPIPLPFQQRPHVGIPKVPPQWSGVWSRTDSHWHPWSPLDHGWNGGYPSSGAAWLSTPRPGGIRPSSAIPQEAWRTTVHAQHAQDNPQQVGASNSRRTYVLDGLNILHHSNQLGQEGWQWEKLIAVCSFYRQRGHDIFVFLPQLSLSENATFQLRTLRQRFGQDCVVTTPSGRSDDAFMISYVKHQERHHAIRIVTNDQLRDHRETMGITQKWVDATTVKFAFAAGTFIPEDVRK